MMPTTAKSRKLFVFLSALLAVAIALSGCNNADNQGKTAEKNRQMKPQNTADRTVIPYVVRGKAKLISVRDLVSALELRTAMDEANQVFFVGDNDPILEIPFTSTQAKNGGNNVALSQSAFIIKGAPHLIADDAIKLFGNFMQAKKIKNGLELTAIKKATIPQRGTKANNVTGFDIPDFFRDDPADPSAQHATFLPTAALANIDINQVIAFSRRYLGVEYEFGAKPYPQSGKFDCSTFTRYVFGKFGVQLPRTARAQSEQGEWVDRQALRKGDLLFFNVPGRFKSDRIVGHVGIYMGNGEMIHSSPSPKDGVQITSINKPYWKRTFLSAKRVAY